LGSSQREDRERRSAAHRERDHFSQPVLDRRSGLATAQQLPPRLVAGPAPPLDFYIGPALIVYYYRINTTRKPFNDVRVRRALNLAVDREQITRDVLGVGQLPAHHFVPPGIRGYQPPDTAIRYDVQKRRSC
jgi:ABC-type transport system substrate-binding protein